MSPAIARCPLCVVGEGESIWCGLQPHTSFPPQLANCSRAKAELTHPPQGPPHLTLSRCSKGLAPVLQLCEGPGDMWGAGPGRATTLSVWSKFSGAWFVCPGGSLTPYSGWTGPPSTEKCDLIWIRGLCKHYSEGRGLQTRSSSNRLVQ